MRHWYRITAAAAQPAEAHLYIYGVIGSSFFDEAAVTAKQLVDDLAALPESLRTVHLHLNSPGGDPFDGIAIANALRNHRARVEVSIEALAASAASIVAMGGDVIRIADNAMIMIHRPSAIVAGGADDMREMAAALDAVTDALVATYKWHTPLGPAEVKALMDAVTWMGAEEALAKGFATEIAETAEVEASFPPESIRALGTIPELYRQRIAALTTSPAPVPPPAPAPIPAPVVADPVAVLTACDQAGVTFLARPLIAAKVTPEQLTARVTAAREIRALCAMAKLPEIAELLIRDGVAPRAARELLTMITALMDKAEIDSGLAPDSEPRRGGFNALDVYKAPQAGRPSS